MRAGGDIGGMNERPARDDEFGGVGGTGAPGRVVCR